MLVLAKYSQNCSKSRDVYGPILYKHLRNHGFCPSYIVRWKMDPSKVWRAFPNAIQFRRYIKFTLVIGVLGIQNLPDGHSADFTFVKRARLHVKVDN